MNGTRYFLDTNAIIAYLSGNARINEVLSDASWIGRSVISVLEFLSFPQLSTENTLLVTAFLDRIEVIGIPPDLPFLTELALFKKDQKLKLPDALIAGSAIHDQATLISNDKHFQNLNTLKVLSF